MKSTREMLESAEFKRLVSRRWTISITLLICLFVLYYGYILLIAFNKEFLATKTGTGVMTWGMPIGLFVIVFTVVITGIYVRRANKQFDELTSAIQARVQA